MTGRTPGSALAAIVGLAAALAGCGPNAARQPAPPVTVEADAGPFTGPVSDSSVYAMDLALTDQSGRTRSFASLRGRVLVAAMFYTSCKSACPRLTADLKSIERRLPAAERERVRFALFSLDPARDSPAALRAFAAKHALDPAHWTLYSAGEDGVRDLAAVLGVRYRADGGGEFAHSSIIFLIDREGLIRYRQVGVAADASEFLTALAATR
jgi:protein SCO1/2